MKRFYFIGIFFLIFINANVYSCNPEPGIQHFPPLEVPKPQITNGFFETFNRLNGLPSNNIRSLIIHKGLLLVGTEDMGLVTYDKKSWQTYNQNSQLIFPASTINSFCKKSETSILAGTPLGLIEIILNKKNKIRKFKKLPISNNQNLNILDISISSNDASELLLGCNRAVGFLNSASFIPIKFEEHLAPTGFSSVFVNKDISVAGSSNGLFEIKGGIQIPFKSSPPITGWINDICSVNERRFYAASSEGVFHHNPGSDTINILPGIWSTALAFNAEATDFLDGAKNQKKFEISAPPELLAKSTLAYQELEREHAQLEADYNVYLNTYRETAIAPQEEVNAMWERFANFYSLMQSYRELGMRINIPLSKGLWIGTQNQGAILFSSSGKNFHLTTENSKIPSNEVTTITSATSGETWIGTKAGGLLHYTRYVKPNSKDLTLLQKCKPNKIRLFGNYLFICTEKNGLYIYDAGSLELLTQISSDIFTAAHEDAFDCAMDDSGKIWLTGNKGIITWDGKKISKVPFHNLETPISKPNLIEIDSNGKIFVSCSNAIPLSEQVYIFNGEFFENFNINKISKVLSLKGKKKQAMLKLLGLTKTYQNELKLSRNASESFNFPIGDSEPITAIFNTDYYLLMGTQSGLQYIFDGQGFKILSEKGTGKLGKILCYKKLDNSNYLILGENGLRTFDGLTYTDIPPISDFNTNKLSDVCLDERNPQCFWVSFNGIKSGGISFYQSSVWETLYFNIPVNGICQTLTHIFISSDEGVYYLPNTN